MTALSFFLSHTMVLFSPLDQLAIGKFASFCLQSFCASSPSGPGPRAMGVSPYLQFDSRALGFLYLSSLRFF